MGKKFLDQLTEKLGLYDEEEAEYVDEEELEPVEEEKPKPEPTKRRPSFPRNTGSKPIEPLPIKPVKEVRPAEPEEEHKPKRSLFGRNKDKDKKTISMDLAKKQIKVVVIEPASFDDSQKVADYLRNNQPVVVNFESTDKVVKKRMTDFVSGTIYALGGSIKKIGANILVCAPKNVDIDAGAGAIYAEKGEGKWNR